MQNNQELKIENMQQRPPVVVVLGHVDHGKTTLLDYIRKTNVAAREAGGITQSIGAYEIEHASSASSPKGPGNANAPARMGRKITFIDTPGHEAFSKMRERGANAADLAVLVVAADEGIKPQTSESIKILQETKIPFVVAITKIDKSNVDTNKVKNELVSAGALLEGYGGQVSYQEVSSKTGKGINELLDLLLLAADLENLTYSPEEPASGFVLETRMDSRRGQETALIIKNGVLKRGGEIFTRTAKGKVKILENFLGEPVKELAPSAPALVIGFEKQPLIGEEFFTTPLAAAPEKEAAESLKIFPSEEKDDKILKIILKAGDAGSLEAISGILKSFAGQKTFKIIDFSIGNVNDNDVKLAISAKASIFAFKTGINKSADNLCRANNVKVISSEIIYDIVEKTEEILKQLENPEPLGILEVLAIFNQDSAQKQIIGGKIAKGMFKNRANFEIERNNEIISSGKVLNLQQKKKDATEVGENNEAGLLVSSEVLIKTGDRLIINL